MNKIIIFFLILALLTPLIALADSGGFLAGRSEECREQGDCTFCEFFSVVLNVFTFFRNNLAFPIAILMIIYGGLVIIFSGGSTDKRTQGRKVLMAAVIGFAIIVGVSLILNTTLILLTDDSDKNWTSFVTGKIKCKTSGFDPK